MFKARTQANYQHHPLPPGCVTRVLRLHPGAYHNPIHIDIAPLAWGLTNMRSVEALSYAWGDAKDLVPINVGAESHSFLVTRNLASALLHLRYLFSPRTLWVDAICINQADDQERTTQVARMGEIYSLAKVVLVWLGEEGDDSSYTLRLLEQLGAKVEVDLKRFKYAWLPGHEHNQNLAWYPLPEPRAWWALYRLLSRPWFERLWIRQEIQKASDALVICGHWSLSWELFKSGFVMTWWGGQRPVTFQPARTCSRIDQVDIEKFEQRLMLVLAVCGTGQYSLPLLRHFISNCVCSDDRDRLYGILSLIKPDSINTIVPRYDISAEQLYQDVTTQYIDKWRTGLSILCQCELRPNPRLSLPSWVPDWSIDPLQGPIFTDAPTWASAGLYSDTSFSWDQGILWTHGLHIEAVRSVHPWDSNTQSFLDWVWDLGRLLDTPDSTDNHHFVELLLQFCETLCCGYFHHTRVPARDGYPEVKTTTTLTGELLGSRKSDLQSWRDALNSASRHAWGIFESEATRFCKNRSFIVTTRGGFALGPLLSRPGDRLSVLLGCEDNMVIRESIGGSQIVGCSYVCGAAHGEPLVGAMPENLQCVRLFDRALGGFHNAFQDKGTLEVSFFDPRLVHLRPDLEEACKDDRWPGYTFVDPENLRKAGIAVEEIKLI